MPLCRQASLVTPKSELAPSAEWALAQPVTAGRRDDDARRVAGTSGAQSARIVSSRWESGVVTASIPRLAADKLGTPPFRSDCASQNFSIIVTKKRSTRFYEIQGPVCVDGLVLRYYDAVLRIRQHESKDRSGLSCRLSYGGRRHTERFDS
jgi:hypothetical protein